jgi:hypothetical protein
MMKFWRILITESQDLDDEVLRNLDNRVPEDLEGNLRFEILLDRRD